MTGSGRSAAPWLHTQRPCTCHTSSLKLGRAASCWFKAMEPPEIRSRSVRVLWTCAICTCLVLLAVATRSFRQASCARGAWVTTPMGIQGSAHHQWGIQRQSEVDKRQDLALEDSSVHPLLQRIFVSITHSWLVLSLWIRSIHISVVALTAINQFDWHR